MLVVERIESLLVRANAAEHVICFGVGKRIKDLEHVFDGTGFLEKIDYFVDNDKTKQGTQICIGNRKIDVISFAELKTKDVSGTFFLITCVKYTPILEQIDAEESFRDVSCYCLTHLLILMREDAALKKKIPDRIKRSKTELIPRVIHYCWFGGKPLPDKYRKWMESWHRHCPDYKIVEWNENNYDISKYRYVRQAYEHKKWGFVSDAARLDIIYHYGGIYLDTDVELISNIDDLLYQRGFACFEVDKVNTGLGFGAVKGLPVIKDMLDFYNTIEFVKDDGNLNLTACPVWQTTLLKEKGLVPNGEYQIVEDLAIFPEKMLSGKCGYNMKPRLTSYTRSIHHYDGSWLNETDKKFSERIAEDLKEIQ